MNDQTVIDIAAKSVWVTIQIAAPILIAAMLVGLIISIFQAATQINEQTLSFIPKIIIMMVVFVIFGPWILQVIVNFTIMLFNQISSISTY